MPLTHNEVLTLYARIRHLHVPGLGHVLDEDDDGVAAPVPYTDAWLLAERKQTLDRFSTLIQLEQQSVRVFDDAIHFSHENRTAEFYGRGLDTARAVIAILQHAEIINDGSLPEMIGCFHNNMQQHITAADYKKARAELKRFNGAMARFLSDTLTERSGSPFRFRKAVQAINFVRDFLWKRDICTPSCVVEGTDNNTRIMLRHAAPMRFQEISLYDSESNPWLYQAAGWRRKLSRSVDGKNGNGQSLWLDSFMQQHEQTMRTLSSTPMSRFTPNPANAFDCTDVIIDTSQEAAPSVVNIGSHRRIAVTEPLQASKSESRDAVTHWNHHLLLRDTQLLKGALDVVFQQWGTLFQQANTVTVPLLHQTLIGDEVTFAPDQGKARSSRLESSVINSKIRANAHLRRWLENHIVLRHRDTGEISFTPNQQNFVVPQTHQRINIALLETNNCVNMWHSRARIRNRDVSHARHLIALAADRFEAARDRLGEDDQGHLNTVIRFLRSADHALVSPFKYRGSEVKSALQALSYTLRTSQHQHDGFSDHNLALALAAAVELKCTAHETWAVSMRRVVGNFTRHYFRMLPVIGHVADWAVRGSMTASAFFLRYTVNLVNIYQTFRHHAYRREIAKAAYEGLLAESLGILQGGCMSSVDRAGEMAEQRAAMRKQFAAEGRLVSYNDSPAAKQEFYKTYSRSDAKRAFALMATGSEGTSDDETRGVVGRDGVISAHQPKDEQKMVKHLKSMRKGEYARNQNPKKYLQQTTFFTPQDGTNAGNSDTASLLPSQTS